MNQFENNELYHHGIKGQKWGVRRYQPYPDGSSGKMVGLAAKRAVTYGKSKGKNKDEKNPVNEAFNSAANMSRQAANLSRKKTNASVRKKADKEVEKEKVHEMTDQELRNKVNRMQMEQQYTMLKENQIRRGRGKVADFLDRFGDRITIAASAASLAVSILKIREMLGKGSS